MTKDSKKPEIEKLDVKVPLPDGSCESLKSTPGEWFYGGV